MLITKSEDVTKQGFCKILCRNSVFGRVFYWVFVGGSVVGWALINFFCLKDGRLLEVGANSRLGA